MKIPAVRGYAENAISHNLIMCNKANLLNQSAFLLGVPGSGKSFCAKELITFLILNTDDDILICDPEGEFAPLVQALGGDISTIIRMAATKIITFINGYHGNTYGSSSMTTVTTRMRKKMGPFLPEIYPFPFFGSDTPDDVCEKECLKEMQRAFDTYLPADDVAAVIIEPVQGDGGFC